eukprot:202027_1
MRSFISIVAALTAVICQTTSQSNAWRKVLKINRAVPTISPYPTNITNYPYDWYFEGEPTYNTLVAEEASSHIISPSFALEASNFRSRLIDEWKNENINVSAVKLTFCDQGNEEQWVIFNTTTADWKTWLDPQFVISSSWSDLNSSVTIWDYGIKSTKFFERAFLFHKSAGGCYIDIIWFLVSAFSNSGCADAWNEGEVSPQIFYSRNNTVERLIPSLEGEAMIMYITTTESTTNHMQTTNDLSDIQPTHNFVVEIYAVDALHDFHPECNDVTVGLPAPTVDDGQPYYAVKGFDRWGGLGVAFTHAYVDDSDNIIYESPLSNLVWKSWSVTWDGEYHEPFMTVDGIDHCFVNAHVAYLMNFDNRTQWKRIGIKNNRGSGQVRNFIPNVFDFADTPGDIVTVDPSVSCAPVITSDTCAPTNDPSNDPTSDPTTRATPRYSSVNVSFPGDGIPISAYTFLGDPYGRFEAYIDVVVDDPDGVLKLLSLCAECFIWQYRLQNGAWKSIDYTNNNDISVYNKQNGINTYQSRLTVQSARRLKAGRCVDESDNSRIFKPRNNYELRLKFV